jgi:hypothetical protein
MSYVFSSTKSEKRAEHDLPVWGGLWGEVAQTMYIHVSRCKNNKIEGERKKEYTTDNKTLKKKKKMSQVL